MVTHLLPETAWPAAMLAGLCGVLCDIDGTITTGGRMTAAAYGALEQLQEAGLVVVPVTGRPAGWCDLVARFWPVSAVVGESGAFYFRYDHGRRQMIRCYARSDAERARIGSGCARSAPRSCARWPGRASRLTSRIGNPTLRSTGAKTWPHCQSPRCSGSSIC